MRLGDISFVNFWLNPNRSPILHITYMESRYPNCNWALFITDCQPYRNAYYCSPISILKHGVL